MSSDVTYEGTWRLELLRAVGVWLTVVGAVGLVFLGGQLFVWEDPGAALVSLAIFACGLAVLLRSRARLKHVWERNKPYLLSEQGALVMHGRREAADRLARASHVLLALFVLIAIGFFFLFSAISCGDRVDGYCGEVGTPPEDLVVTVQVAAIVVGAAWAGIMTMRRRQDDETERIDLLVAEGQRRRRNDHPMAGTDRSSWE